MIGNLALGLYSFVTSLGRLFVYGLLRHRMGKGKEDVVRWAERRGRPSMSRPEGPLVWVHGASVGETISILPIVDRILAEGVNVLITSGTVTSARLLDRRLPPGAYHQYLPMDVPLYMQRFFNHWRPDLGLIAESELWPNMLMAADKRTIPVVLINARMSARSHRRWKRFPRIARSLMTRLDLCLAQSEDDARRLTELGAPRVTVTGNLKFDVPAPPADHAKVAALEGLIAGRTVWIAASTHPGEEQAILETHKALSSRIPHLLTIIAPRHPQRGGPLFDAAQALGITCGRRSQRALPTEDVGLYVVDTIGEMGQFYRVSPLAFMGGSLVNHGGQNPIEPAKLGTAILHGPHVHNFVDTYSRLDLDQGAREISAETLTETVGELLGNPAQMREMSRTASQVIVSLSGAADRTMSEIAPFLVRMHIESR
jgi:3-deoxy-D-manno-octulosonic-acid transferase